VLAADSGNEVDSESEPYFLNIKPLVAYLDEPPCNNDVVSDEDEWVWNENVSFEYDMCPKNVSKSLDLYRLHIPNLTSMEAFAVEEL
ncbi:hypothetical protein, partial [Alteromonas stellipolaris]|uniref:hypothetical protein n=1 Tax=Alteromonas stellipolaris TaxID=233316 RepID=UPI001D487ECA